ncbi:hypothetical protein NLI96_g5330 [Meripilus lineatus]|uniref:GOLD domain-containing protein n=1 Tax=Meripilus lineatus TaxID=2056292 RepID=A0AAD5V527_9APHY|nr:hypothetical protein NLI96_g5330 [Physisporinus lineatus]
MSRQRSSPLISLCLLLFLSATANALHFYLDTNEKRCFLEEVPSNTVVEGMPARPPDPFGSSGTDIVSPTVGHYKALEWSEREQKYVDNPNLGVLVEVDEIATGHNVVRTRGPNESRFTFTSHDSGDHSVCLSSNYGATWFSNTHIRLYLDIVVGSTKADHEHDRSHVSELSAKLRDLNQKLEDIRREQQYQREREANFRDLSELTNSRAVWYSMAQILVLVLTCGWQLRHLRRFFEDRKT